MSTLYLVSTPIGNLADITLRGLEILNSVDVILCEDTREIHKITNIQHSMLNTGDAKESPKLLSYNDHVRDRRIPEVIEILMAGQDVALVSDRGTPLVSDPGYKLVQAVIKLSESDPNVKIDAIPGANAILPALQLSGLPPDRFYFVGFLPKKKTARRKLLKELPSTTIVAFESPHRLTQTLDDIQETLGDIPMAICIELTKMYQEVFRGKVSEAIERFTSKKPKGEITLVFAA